MNTAAHDETIGAMSNGAAPSELDRLVDEMEEGEERFSAAVRTTVSATDAYVRRSPWQFVGIAAVAGAVVGYLLSRRQKGLDA